MEESSGNIDMAADAEEHGNSFFLTDMVVQMDLDNQTVEADCKQQPNNHNHNVGIESKEQGKQIERCPATELKVESIPAIEFNTQSNPAMELKPERNPNSESGAPISHVIEVKIEECCDMDTDTQSNPEIQAIPVTELNVQNCVSAEPKTLRTPTAPVLEVHASRSPLQVDIARDLDRLPGADQCSRIPPGMETGRVPLWIKWRGKWQAGLQCSLEDCPAQTAKAMPKYGRKSYIVVFFPNNKSFVWTDWQLVCPISENPEPLAFGSHESGRNSVADINEARQYMLQKISTSMLDICDRLPLQVVVDRARDISFWKEFAKEASNAVTYEELGVMLMKLKSMILSTFLKESWIHNRINEWEHQCKASKSAGCLESLVKELRNAVCWDDISKLWDELEQSNLDSEWKTWKDDAHCGDFVSVTGRRRIFDLVNSSPERSEEPGRVADSDAEQAFKRAKIDEQELMSKLPEALDDSSLHGDGHIADLKEMTVVGNTSNSELITNENAVSEESDPKTHTKSSRCVAFSERKGRQCNKYAKEGDAYCCKHSPLNRREELRKGKLPMPSSLDDDSSAVICSGMTKYGRRCTHRAKEGSIFCLKHMLQECGDSSKVPPAEDSATKTSGPETPDVNAGLQNSIFNRKRKLEDMTAGDCSPLPNDTSKASSKITPLSTTSARCIGLCGSGAQCSHRAKPGSAFCEKHVAGSQSETIMILNAGESSPVPNDASMASSKMTPQSTNSTRCIGLCGSGAQCSHRAKPGSAYCEKHVPGSQSYARKVLEKNTSIRTSFVDETVDILQLKKLIEEYVKACLDSDASRGSFQKHIDWALSQVSGNLKASESLYEIIAAETEHLRKRIDEEDVSEKVVLDDDVPKEDVPKEPPKEDVPKEPPKDDVPNEGPKEGVPNEGPKEDVLKGPEEDVPEDEEPKHDVPEAKNSLVPFFNNLECVNTNTGTEKSTEHLSNVELLKQVSSASNLQFAGLRCKLCTQDFVELTHLAQHWRACHKKEAQQYFRGYICQYCNLTFANKKGMYRHRNAQHSNAITQSKSSLLALCVICSGRFVNFEDLWQHVICSHPDQFCAFWPVSDPVSSAALPKGFDISDVGKCSQCDQKFHTSTELQQHITFAHKEQKQNQENGEDLKFKCKICGMKFRLLPDLGRHHQAEHKNMPGSRAKTPKKETLITPVTSVTPITPVTLAAGLVEELSPMVVPETERKKLQKLHIRRAPGIVQNRAEVVSSIVHDEDHVTVESIEGYLGQKMDGYPTSQEIIAVARSACCKIRLHSVLQKKYNNLPESLDLEAAKLCLEANIGLQFQQEGYICPNGCMGAKPSAENNSDASLRPQYIQILSNHEENVESKDTSQETNHEMSRKGDNNVVLCEDISFGKERVPIPCVLDTFTEPCVCPTCVDNSSNDYETLKPWLNFSYVTKRTFDPSLGLDTESSRLACSCQGDKCLPEQCEHVYLFDNDNTDAEDIYGQPMAGRFPYDSQGCIILEEGYLVYECNSVCACNNECQNRVLQKGVQVKLEVYKTRHKGWAVRAAQRIQRGTFVCEYVGEVLDDCEANRRGERYDKEGCSYLYDIDAHIEIRRRGRPKPFVIDATKVGNVARFINHSCSPNLVNYQVLVESMDCQLAHIGLYANRDIEVGEELAYDYRYKLLPGKGCPCHCGAKECRGRLY